MKKIPKLTNLDKLYWPKERISKGDLLNYYETISPFILPYLKNRPLSLKRNPNGILDPGFYHKDAGDIAPPWMKIAEIPSPAANKIIHYLVCNDLPSLLFIANLGCIEMNPWNSTVRSLDKPDYFVMDIDPSDKNDFEDVIEVAQCVKEILDELGISGYCKTSGSTGLHIYIPCGKKYPYERVREFAEQIARLTHERLPSLTTIERYLSKRRKDQIYIDYLQNSKGQTLASAYSARPKPGATVSTPLDWKEVKPGLHPSSFTIRNMVGRVKRKGDLFKGIFSKGFDIEKALKKLEKVG